MWWNNTISYMGHEMQVAMKMLHYQQYSHVEFPIFEHCLDVDPFCQRLVALEIIPM